MKKEEYIKQFFNELKVHNKTNYENFYTTYKHLVYSISYSILKNKDDAEDIVQNVFVKLYNMSPEKLPQKNELSWLYTVTKNEALQLYKKNNKTTSLENIYEIPNTTNDIDKSIDFIEYNKLLSKLNPKQQEIISLKIISDLSFKDISKLLNENENTIKWRYYKNSSNK